MNSRSKSALGRQNSTKPAAKPKLARGGAKIGKLPGLGGIELMSKALYAARERSRQDPEWGRRLIANEAWAVAPPKRSPVGELTGRRHRGGNGLAVELVET